jgi:sulfoxide reductase heme-binding subunit YedZ
VASEIVLRIYLTIGFTALLGLVALAATSTDAMARRLGGRRWRRLHRIVYAIAILGSIHFFMQSKLDIYEPTIMAGVLAWLLGWRLLHRFGVDMRGALASLLLTIGVALLVAVGEALYFNLAMRAPLALVLEANLTLETGLRPAVVVAGIGLALSCVAALRQAGRRAAAKRPQAA